MSNLAQVYSNATGKAQLAAKRALENEPPNLRDVPSITESELSIQNKLDWLSHPRTVKMFEQIGDMVAECRSKATLTACSPSPNNTLILQELNRANILEFIIKTYCH